MSFAYFTSKKLIWKLNRVALLGHRSELILNILETASASDLLQKLKIINIKVPPRTRCRTKEQKKQRETRIICYFLATICKTDLLEYPLRVKHTDRPDILLFMPSGCRGVEIVEAVPQTKAEVEAYSEHKDIVELTRIPSFKAGEQRRSREEIRAIARGTFPFLPYMDDSIERNWVEAMLYFSKDKADRFQQPGFKKFEHNWLLIYDDWSPIIGLNESMTTASLGGRLFSQNWESPFELVFILGSQAIWKFCNSAKPVKYLIRDLWHERSPAQP